MSSIHRPSSARRFVRPSLAERSPSQTHGHRPIRAMRLANTCSGGCGLVHQTGATRHRTENANSLLPRRRAASMKVKPLRPPGTGPSGCLSQFRTTVWLGSRSVRHATSRANATNAGAARYCQTIFAPFLSEQPLLTPRIGSNKLRNRHSLRSIWPILLPSQFCLAQGGPGDDCALSQFRSICSPASVYFLWAGLLPPVELFPLLPFARFRRPRAFGSFIKL